MSTSKTESKLETVTLIAEHKHGGVTRQAGDKIDVTSTEKAWLVSHKKVAEPTPAKSKE